MKKIFFYLLLFSLILSANQPYKKITTNNFITSLDLYKNTLYVSTDKGEVEIYNTNTNKKIGSIKLDSINDYFGNKLLPKVFHTHTLDGKNILIVSQDNNSGSKISIYNNKKMYEVKPNNQTSMISKAYFIDSDKILFGSLSNEISLYSLSQKKMIWHIQPSEAVFSDLIFDENTAISTTEGGIIYLIDLENGNIIKSLEGANFDNVYMLASAKNIILSAGRDKTCGIYDKVSGNFKRLETDFLSYAVGISKDSTLGAVSLNENNDILIFNTTTLSRIDILKGGNALPNTIIFIDNENIISGFDSKSILFWKIGDKK
ncbi:hypothetical protein CCY99_04975 [Helicobacter sp. 16-1353]|uniref:WD40 repeat domain-containing protein n=1 Tax=Helicobacter sp. 16-1353 TaxID=2004996 RepID=UPI000DCF1432|nr:hypothetical protein [Helicobacter sp. 16-1353]RAX54036.1 hypothetical protein CCY99_04975 [Helicobacter sp. 16-1353]